MAPDLPIEDDEASLFDQAEVVLDAVRRTHENGELMVVGQSYGGYLAPIVAQLAMADHLVLVAPMIPQPGETADDMWEASGWHMPRDHSGIIEVFYHDVDPDLAREAMSHGRQQSETTGREPWPLDAWPNVPTHVVLCQNDRFFPADWLRGVVRDRLGIEPDELPCGHTPALSRPRELVELIESYRSPASPSATSNSPNQ